MRSFAAGGSAASPRGFNVGSLATSQDGEPVWERGPPAALQRSRAGDTNTGGPPPMSSFDRSRSVSLTGTMLRSRSRSTTPIGRCGSRGKSVGSEPRSVLEP